MTSDTINPVSRRLLNKSTIPENYEVFATHNGQRGFALQMIVTKIASSSPLIRIHNVWNYPTDRPKGIIRGNELTNKMKGINMTKENIRGSAKLAPMTVEELQQSVGSARAFFEVKRFIKKGIPPIYDVEASLAVSQKEKVGEVVQEIINLQTATRNIGVVIFPYGIPFVDGALLNVTINGSAGPGPAEAGL
jgi:hypothetical protein